MVELGGSDFIRQFLPPYMGVIPNPKMAFIFPISCIFPHIFPLFMKYFPKCEGKGSFPKSQIKSLGGIRVDVNEELNCGFCENSKKKIGGGGRGGG